MPCSCKFWVNQDSYRKELLKSKNPLITRKTSNGSAIRGKVVSSRRMGCSSRTRSKTCPICPKTCPIGIFLASGLTFKESSWVISLQHERSSCFCIVSYNVGADMLHLKHLHAAYILVLSTYTVICVHMLLDGLFPVNKVG